MPATISEFFRSGNLATGSTPDDAQKEHLYTILDTESEDEALALLASTAPATVTVDGWLLSKRQLSVDHESHKLWRGKANWSKRAIDIGESAYDFETGGGNLHITHSLQTMQVRARAGLGTPPTTYNAIGWDGQRIAGCEIFGPVYNFSETHTLDIGDISAYKLALFRATGKVNDNTFKTFAAGEVLFLGARGSKRGNEPWQINYRFAASENMSNITVGGITSINKKGWEYLWLYFDDEISQDVLVKRPSYSFVEQVYRLHDFNNIGIGV